MYNKTYTVLRLLLIIYHIWHNLYINIKYTFYQAHLKGPAICMYHINSIFTTHAHPDIIWHLICIHCINTRATSAWLFTPADTLVFVWEYWWNSENYPSSGDSQYYSTIPPPSLQLHMFCCPLLLCLPTLRNDLSILLTYGSVTGLPKVGPIYFLSKVFVTSQ